MADKYLALSSGQVIEVEATVTSAGAGDAGEIPALDGTGKLDSTVMPASVGASTKSVVCTEDLSAGDIVNLYNDGGTIKVRKADADGSKPAHGFVLSGYTSGQSATVYGEGSMNTQLSGMTPGARQYLSDTAGGVTETAPSDSGDLVQYVGTAWSPTELRFAEGMVITLA
jgi:hypothetical protein